MVKQWNSDGGTVLVEQCWWNSVVEQCDSEVRIVWWNSDGRLVLVEKWKSDRGTVLWHSVGGTVWWKSANSGKRMVEQRGGTVEQ